MSKDFNHKNTVGFFCKTILPGWIDIDKAHTVVIATYQDKVGYHTSGFLKLGDHQQLFVATTKMGYAYCLKELLWLDEKLNQDGCADVPIFIQEEPSMVFLYTGLPSHEGAYRLGYDFENVHEFTFEYKSKHPHSKLVVVSCKCSLEAKLETFEELITENRLDYYLIGNCGGDNELSQLVDCLEKLTEA